MKPFSELNLPAGKYPGDDISIINDIYNPILSNSLVHKRSTYSFNSESLYDLTEGLEGFVNNGGKIYLLIGDTLSKKEEISIFIGSKNKEKGYEDLCLQRLKQLIKDKDKYDNKFKFRLGLLTNLIGSDKLEIRFCYSTKNLKNLQHSKLGIFEGQNGEVVAWDSSSNQSHNGLLENLESLVLFKSWDDFSGYRVHGENIQSSFKKLWKGFDHWKTIKVPSKFYREFTESFPQRDPLTFKKIKDKSKNTESPEIIPRDYQTLVLKHWIENKFFGIVQHATGSGKSITGILAIKDFFKLNPKGTCILLVPGDLLLKQWMENIKEFIPEAGLYSVSSKNPIWKKEIPFNSEPSAGPNIIVTSMRSAVTPAFLNHVTQGNHLMILADEAHNLGSKERSKVLSLSCGAAMALSATINRPNDDFGNNIIKEFFKNYLLPKYGIQEALDDDRLTQYNYYPTSVLLSETEQNTYEEYSIKISKVYASMVNEKNPERRQELSNKFQQLSIARAKVLKKAVGKIPAAVKIIKNHFKKGERWLVYCEDIDHLQALSSALENENMATLHYYSKLSSNAKKNEELKDNVMKIFEGFGGIMLSIGCLDEGVDIPSASHALILASSQNERQYIQRRGRVLRKDNDRPLKVAHIFDVIVVSSGMREKDLNRISNIELKRAMEFCSYSRNNAISRIKLQEIAAKANIDLDEIDSNSEFEEDNK